MHEGLGLTGRAAERAAISEIAHETTAIRAELELTYPEIRTDAIDLGSRLFLPTAYEAGAITSQSYTLEDLPPNTELRSDLDELARMYPVAVDIKNQLVALDPTTFRTPATSVGSRKPRVDFFFRPKDAGDYLVTVPSHVQHKSRKHEALIDMFGSRVRESGWTPNTNVHPRDLELTRGDETWLVEAKTVGPNAEHAVRDAIGQLIAYRHFCYREAGHNDPSLLALFNEPVGKAFVRLLESVGIAACWRVDGQWRSTPDANHLLNVDTVDAECPLRR